MAHPMGPGVDVVILAKRLKENQHSRHRDVLRIYVEARSESDCFYFVAFSKVAKELGLPVTAVRRSTRYLQRKGLTKYAKGLFHEDGTVAGAGYAATTLGSAVHKLLEA